MYSGTHLIQTPLESVLIREVSLFQGLNSTQTWEEESVPFRVSLFQGCPYRGVPLYIYICSPTTDHDVSISTGRVQIICLQVRSLSRCLCNYMSKNAKLLTHTHSCQLVHKLNALETYGFSCFGATYVMWNTQPISPPCPAQ